MNCAMPASPAAPVPTFGLKLLSLLITPASTFFGTPKAAE
jgi:hypothetical protein